MRAFLVRLPSGVRYWTVLDGDLAVVAVADSFLRQVRFGRDGAESTTRAYAGSIALFLRWCAGSAGLTRSAALEVARQGVRINAVCASSVETAMDDKFRAGKGITHEQLAQAMPIGRTCRPEEVAPAVLFLCSDPNP